MTFTAKVATGSGTGVATGSVDFMNGSAKLGSAVLNGAGVATLTIATLAAGTYAVTAAYGGDAGNAASVSSPVSLVVGVSAASPDFSLSLTPAAGSTASGGSLVASVWVGALNAFAGVVSFACSGLPAQATCSFSPATVTASGAAVATTLTIATGTTAAGLSSQLGVLGTFPGLLLLPMFSRRVRRRAWLGALTMALAAGLSFVGCGGNSGGGGNDGGVGASRTPAGTYAVTVNATSGSLSHAAVYTLTVK